MEELGEAMRQAGQEVAVDDLKDMIKAVDINGKQQTYSPEFVIKSTFSLSLNVNSRGAFEILGVCSKKRKQT